jgi:hypothetical protein
VARIRTIKPEFWTDEKMALLDPLTRLVFLGLISNADDHGRLIDNVKMLDGQIFPFTDDTCLEALETLAKLSRILRYTSKSGQNLIQVIGWKNHQRVDHPGKEILPAPIKEDWLQPVAGQRPLPEPPKGSRKPREGLTLSSRSDLGPTTNDLGALPAATPVVAKGKTKPPKYPGFPTEASRAIHSQWIKDVGSCDIAVIRKTLSDYFPASGPLFELEEILEAVKAFSEIRKGQSQRERGFYTIHKFASDLVEYVRLGKQEYQDEFGAPTERMRLSVGA